MSAMILEELKTAAESHFGNQMAVRDVRRGLVAYVSALSLLA